MCIHLVLSQIAPWWGCRVISGRREFIILAYMVANRLLPAAPGAVRNKTIKIETVYMLVSITTLMQVV